MCLYNFMMRFVGSSFNLCSKEYKAHFIEYICSVRLYRYVGVLLCNA